MIDKIKFHRAAAIAVAKDLCDALSPLCEPDRLIVAGSLRRRKQMVGDVEILYVPKTDTHPDGLFDSKAFDLTDLLIDKLLHYGLLKKRPNSAGYFTWGPKNKLAIHSASGIPVDLFATTEACWWNSLVCRTGGKENNLLITTTANRQGWSFEAYGSGFMKLDKSDHYQTKSERDVYDFIGLPYLDPSLRK